MPPTASQTCYSIKQRVVSNSRRRSPANTGKYTYVYRRYCLQHLQRRTATLYVGLYVYHLYFLTFPTFSPPMKDNPSYPFS